MRNNIFSLLLLFLFSCKNEKDGHANYKWLHSQIIGHEALMELNTKVPALFIGVSVSDKSILEKNFFLGKKGIKLKVEEFKEEAKILILKTDLEGTFHFLGQEIKDSILYKKALKDKLESSYLGIKETGEKIYKADSYKVKFGYIIKRIPLQ